MSIRLPRMVRALGAYALTLPGAVASRVTLWILLRLTVGPGPERQNLLFGVRAIARELGLSRRQTWSLIQSGAIPTGKLGSVVCVRRATLKAHLDRMENGASEP